ncbi:MAG: glutathione S-transferase, partial [Gammaproteobacteria bacterium]|nr:glutathione S-transferase [Gammaproteobacteria bacterium]
GCDSLEASCKRGFEDFDIGQASMLHAISYMDFRVNFYDAKDPLYPDFDCFDGRPNLRAWWQESIQRPSVTCHYNKDFEGDDSAAFLQQNVQDVLAAQAAGS